MLLLWVPWSGVDAMLHQKEWHLTVLTKWLTVSMLLLRLPGPRVGAALHQKEWRLTVLTDELLCRLRYAATTCVGICSSCCAVLTRTAPHCVNWLIDGAGYAMLLLRVPGPWVCAALHQKEWRLTVTTDWLITQGFAMLQLRVPGSGASAALH